MSLYQEELGDMVYVIDVKDYLKEDLRKYLKDFLLCGYNLQFDLGVLGFTYETAPQFHDLYIASKYTFYYLDEFNLASVLRSAGIDYSLDKKRLQKTDWSKPILSQEQLEYSAYDTYLLPMLRKAIKAVNPNAFREPVYLLDLEVSRLMLTIERNGLQVNEQAKFTFKKETEGKLFTLTKEIPFNFNSPKQVSTYFKTPKADKEMLVTLASKGNELAQKVLEAKALDKTLSFLDKYTDRVFGHFNVCGARSGRMTCSSENIQQIPRHLRGIFGFSEQDERVYVIADYPQIELRLAGVLWNVQEFLSAFKQDLDLHKYTASVIYNKPEDAVEKQERQIAKSANFGLLYGMGAEKFQKYVFTNTGIALSLDEAQSVRQAWLNLFSSVAKRHKKVGNKLSVYGEYEDITWLGRRYKTESFTEALNLQIQGSGADLIKTALSLFKYRTSVVNVIHDEIVVETTQDKAEEVKEALKVAMEKAWVKCMNESKLPVEPLTLEVKDVIITKSLRKE